VGPRTGLDDVERRILHLIKRIYLHAGFEVLTAITMKRSDALAITPCSSKRARRFGGTDGLLLQGRIVRQARNYSALPPRRSHSLCTANLVFRRASHERRNIYLGCLRDICQFGSKLEV
jgi:hypothetical protein